MLLRVSRIALFAFVFLSVPFVAVATETVRVDWGYKPDRKVETVLSADTATTMDLDADEEVASVLRATGMKFPLDMSQISRVDTLLETGPLAADGSFPVRFEIVDVTMDVRMDGESMSVPMDLGGVSSSGVVEPDGSFRLELFDAPNLDEGARRFIQRSLQASSIPMPPGRAMRVGESYTDRQELPLPAIGGMPTAGTAGVAYTYKLVSADARRAYFDVDVALDVSGSLAEGAERVYQNATVNGNGRFVYNRETSLVESVEMYSTMELQVDVAGGRMLVRAVSEQRSESRLLSD